MVYEEVDFLDYIVKSLVSDKDSIVIERSEDEFWVLLTLSVSKNDMWIIIWKWWNTVKSLRTIIRLLWVKLWKKINLKVLD